MKTGFVVIYAPFHKEDAEPLIMSATADGAEKWLAADGWVKSGGYNKGLWEKQSVGGMYWARLVRVEVAK
jgi:hypothetical protein